jgi:hypothetical protein
VDHLPRLRGELDDRAREAAREQEREQQRGANGRATTARMVASSRCNARWSGTRDWVA